MDLTSSCDALSVLHENFGMGMDINNIKREFRQWVENQTTNYPVEKNTNMDAVTTHDDKFEVTIDVYQFKSDEITVKVVNSNTICVEGNYEERNENSSFLSRHFVRKYTIPTGFDIKNMVSTLSSDGILRIMAPRNGRTITVQQTKTSTQNASALHNDEIATSQSVSTQQTQSNSKHSTTSATKKETDETHSYIQQFLHNFDKYKVVPIQQVGPFSKNNVQLQEIQLSMELQPNRTQQTTVTNTKTEKYSNLPIIQTKVSSDTSVTIQNRSSNLKTQESFQSDNRSQNFEVLKKQEYKTVPIEQTNVKSNTEVVCVNQYDASKEATSKKQTQDVYTNVPVQQTGMISQVNKVQTNKHSSTKYSTQGINSESQQPNRNKLENVETLTECTMYETHNTSDGYKTVPVQQTTTTESHNILQNLEKTQGNESGQHCNKRAVNMKNLDEINSNQNYKTCSEKKEFEYTSQVQQCEPETDNNIRKLQNTINLSQELIDKHDSKNLITKTESIEESTTYELYSNRNGSTIQNQIKNVTNVEEGTDARNCEGINNQTSDKNINVTLQEVDNKINRNDLSRNQATNTESIKETTICETHMSGDYKTVPITVIDSQKSTQTITTANTQEHWNKNFETRQQTNMQSLNKNVNIDLQEKDENINIYNKPTNQETNVQLTKEFVIFENYLPAADLQTDTKVMTVVEETLNTQESKNNFKTQSSNKQIKVNSQEIDEQTSTNMENVSVNKPIDQVITEQLIKDSTTYKNYNDNMPLANSQSDIRSQTVLEETTNVKSTQRRTSTSEEHTKKTSNNSKTSEGINIQEIYDQQNYKTSLSKQTKVTSQEQVDENQAREINTHILAQENRPLSTLRNLATNTELSEESITYKTHNTNNYQSVPINSENITKSINDSEHTTNLENTQSSLSQNKKILHNLEEVNMQKVDQQNYNAQLNEKVESALQTQTENLFKNSSNLQTSFDKTRCGHEKNSEDVVETISNNQAAADTFTKVTKHQTRSQRTVKNNSIESQYNISTNFEKAENREGDVAVMLKSGNSTQEFQTYAVEPTDNTSTENEKATKQMHLDDKSQINRNLASETNKQSSLTQNQQHNVVFQENDFSKEDVIRDGYKQKGFTNKSAKAEFEANPHGFKVTNEQTFYTEQTKTKECESNNANKQLDQAHNIAYQVQFSVDSNNSERLSRMPSESSEICIEEVTEDNERKLSSASSGYKRYETSQHVSSNVHVQQN